MNKTELIIKASVVEDALLDDVKKMIEDNPLLFEGEKVVLMADAHRGANVPVGFTMTLSKGLIPVEFVGSDLFCGVTGLIIRDFVPNNHSLDLLTRWGRDLLPVHRRLGDRGIITDMGTLGRGNHYVELGFNGKDTLISVHTGSRNFGGELYKRHLQVAKEHTEKLDKDFITRVMKELPPQMRQDFLDTMKSKQKDYTTPLLNTSLYPNYWAELGDAKTYAETNRALMVNIVFKLLTGTFLHETELATESVESIHNYVDNEGAVPILRKGAIKAVEGERVIIPINMRDGVIVGVAKGTELLNASLPHGAGRVLSRRKAHETLSLEQFKEDMAHVRSSTVCDKTLDESPRAYKSIDVILQDISPYLESYEIFKPIFNYKGVE